MKRAALGLALALVLTGCGSLPGAQAEPGPVVVALFDVSNSTRAVRERYLEAFGPILDYVVENEGSLVADVIDENPIAHSTYPVNETLGGCNVLTENRLECEERARRARERVMDAAQQILTGDAANTGTDIQNGLRLAARVFESYAGAHERHLVVFSDMVERTEELSLGGGFDRESIQPAIKRLEAEGRVPVLNGVSVTVVGAGVVSGKELPAERILTIQEFWARYFQTAGAVLAPENYGAALVRFP